MSFLRTIFQTYLRDCHGGVALTFGLVVPVLLGFTALGVDSAALYNRQAQLQAIADSTALATARELHIYRKKQNVLRTAGIARAEALLTDKGLHDAVHTVSVTIDDAKNLVDVDIMLVAEALMPVSVWQENPIRVEAVAQAYGLGRLCVLTVNPSKSDSIKADGAAQITAPACSVQSNSTDSKGLVVKGGSRITSSVICSSGGADTSDGTVEPAARTDCAPLSDPLASRVPPTVGGCDFLDLTLGAGNRTISPGIYCGGLKIEKGAVITASPGIYTFTQGKLEVKDNSSLLGENVSFFFQDDAAVFLFDTNTTIDLSAPVEGDLAGILFYENRAAKLDRAFTIKSNNARRLLGTIYLPKGKLVVDTKKPVAAESAYTVIVANRLDVKGANLVVNADYAGTDVPVPEGLGPTSKFVRMSK